MTAAEILRAAMAKIEDPAHWTQKAFRRDASGEMCEPESAVCWCAEGAVMAVATSGAEWCAACEVLDEAAVRSMDLYNDSHTHAEVMGVFRRAIELAEETQ